MGLFNGRGSTTAVGGALGTNGFRQVSLTLPATPPPDLSQQQLKRRHIFAAIVHSECSYVSTLQRLVNVSTTPQAMKTKTETNANKFTFFFGFGIRFDKGLQKTIGRE